MLLYGKMMPYLLNMCIKVEHEFGSPPQPLFGHGQVRLVNHRYVCYLEFNYSVKEHPLGWALSLPEQTCVAKHVSGRGSDRRGHID